MKQKPVHQVVTGNIKAVIWQNDRNGQPSFTVRIVRSFKKEEIWHQTTAFFRSDLPKVYEVLLKAEHWIAQQEAEVPQSTFA